MVLQFSTHSCAVSQIILERRSGEMPRYFLKFTSHSGPILNLKERKKKKKSLLPQENNNKIITFFWAVKCQEVKILTVKYTTASSAFPFFFSSLMFSFTLWCDSHCAGCQNLWISGTSGSNGEMVLLELKLLMLYCGCGSDRRGHNLTTGIPAALFVIDLCRISLFFCTSL